MMNYLPYLSQAIKMRSLKFMSATGQSCSSCPQLTPGKR